MGKSNLKVQEKQQDRRRYTKLYFYFFVLDRLLVAESKMLSYNHSNRTGISAAHVSIFYNTYFHFFVILQ